MADPTNPLHHLNPALILRMPSGPGDLPDLVSRLTAGDTGALSKAITLMESSRAEDLSLKVDLFKALEEIPKPLKLRLAISGAPGTGKSTLINAMALHWIEQGKRLAILAVDPSSMTTGGSLLGDKTRMEDLQAKEQVFIRPSPARGHLGGVTSHTLENIRLCEAAGYDLTIVETVGVGQNEVEVRQMVDIVLLVLAPYSGDALQGLKRGIVEIADMVVVNKCDGPHQAQAGETASAYRQALQYLHRSVPVHQVSALEGHGIADLTEGIQLLFTQGESRWPFLRHQQTTDRFHTLLKQHMLTSVYSESSAKNMVNKYEEFIEKESITAELAALQCWQEIRHSWTGA